MTNFSLPRRLTSFEKNPNDSVNTNFDYFVKYVNDRNDGTASWDSLYVAGNVGIGMAPSAAAELQVSSADDTRIYLIDTGSASTFYLRSDGMNTQLGTITNNQLEFVTNSTVRGRIAANGSFVVGLSAIATNATDGFLYVPTCAGTPTGTPTTVTGTAPIVIDTTNNKLYFYSGGTWRDAGP